MDKKLIVLTVISTLLMASVVYAVSGTKTTTLLWFNIGVSRSVQVLTLGGSWATATAGGVPTTGNIEFNSSGSDSLWVNATIIGGTVQTVTSPIMQIRNTGSVATQIDMMINATLPSSPCKILLGWENGTQSNPASPTNPITNTPNVTLATAMGTGETLSLWLYGNFTKCSAGDTTARNFTIFAEFAT
jgi:hypothetical protein